MRRCHMCGGPFGLTRHHWYEFQYCSKKCYDRAEDLRKRLREYLRAKLQR